MSQRLYACYLDVRGPDGRRAQWVLIPPRPQLYNGHTTAGRVDAFYFYREQDRADHRSQWRWRDLTPTLEQQLISTVRFFSQRPGWTPSPLIPVEMVLVELDELCRDRKTPYDVLRRAAAQARRHYGYEV